MSDSGKKPGAGKRPGQGRPARVGQGRGGQARNASQESPIEIGVRSTRNAIRRHSETVRNDETKLACRSMITAVVGTTTQAASPAELLGAVEQMVHVLEAGPRETSQLPATLRAVASFSLDQPRRAKDVLEMLRLILRHGYVLAADHIPRQARDDGAFRASALRDALTDAGALYLDDAAFHRAAGA